MTVGPCFKLPVGSDDVCIFAEGGKGDIDGEPGTKYDMVVEGQLGGGEKKIAGETLDKAA